MLVRLAVALAVLAVVVIAVAAWRRPPRRLRHLDLGRLGIHGPAIVQFSTRYCTPCKAAAPHLRDAADRTGVPYVQIDVGERPEVAADHHIRTVPTIAVARADGRVLGLWTSLPANGEIVDVARRARARA